MTPRALSAVAVLLLVAGPAASRRAPAVEHVAASPDGSIAEDYERELLSIDAGSSIEVRLAPGGGWVARLEPQSIRQ